MSEVIIKEFWKLIRQGDSKAFATLYDQYADMLYNYGYRIVADADLVSNAIQSLFIYIYDKRKNIDMPNQVSAYLCVSLRRLILKEVSDARNGNTIAFDEVVENSTFDVEIDV